MNRHLVYAAAIWAVLSLLGYALVLNFHPFPLAASEQAETIDNAFTLLTLLAVPVFTLVVAVLVYSVLRFRSKDRPTEDGLPLRTHRPLVVIWLLVTLALTVAVIIHPGVTGMHELRAHTEEEAELLVQVEGGRWFWTVTYPGHNVTSRREMVLPMDTDIMFEVTARDVLHAFWVPAFRMKIDAVPGMTTRVHATPNKLGSFEDDPGFRLQCAELCGTGHALMRIPVRVVTEEEFQSWIAQQRPTR